MSHPTLPPEVEEQVRAALAARKKIEAIKIFREATGLGLKESKEAIEAIQRGTTPATTPGPSSGSRPGVETRGCGRTALFLFVPAIALILLYFLS